MQQVIKASLEKHDTFTEAVFNLKLILTNIYKTVFLKPFMNTP